MIACLTCLAQTFSQTSSAADEFARAPRRRSDVVLVEEAVDLHAEILQPRTHLGVDVRQLERDDVAIRILADEGEIDDADRSCLDEVRERRGDLAAELVAGKREDRVIDRSDFLHVSLLCCVAC